MEFHEKLQQLRRERKLTQEQLAEALHVSRTAVSKWESGRGWPNIDSLKDIARFFSVTVDELLSGEELLTVAEEDNRQTKRILLDLVFGLLDTASVLLLFLPLFAQRAEGRVQEVSLWMLTDIAGYLKVAYWIMLLGILLFGVLTLALQNWECALWEKQKRKLSLLLSGMGVLLFTVSLQPYAAVILFLFLTIKVFLLLKKG